MPESRRQLAAIMFTDIVGYTALMGKDSKKAMDLVRQNKSFQKPLVEKHHGKWLKEIGDGAMAQFDSALDAVNCAMEIQRISRADFEADLRIGIHLGDITIENNDVYGDGVNVASRLESIADPGGIYISESIEKAIRGQSDVVAKYLGEIQLKNVDYDVRTYALQGVGLPIPELKDKKEISGHIIAELQRRGIFRSALTYLVISVLLLLSLPLGNDLFNFPDWTKTVMIIFLIIGFPVALYLAWKYERSPEGFVKTTSKQSWRNPYNTSRRKPLTSNFILVVMGVILIVLYVYPRYIGNISTTTEAAFEEVIQDKSIAVLPFTNMSNDPEQEYFSDGMMEEILNHLFQIGDLLVTSRTSVMQYKGTTKTIPEIADELEVNTILEGSVRKSGDQVRITVQLIDGKTDKHLWSETYDRKMNDVFAIQSEVAKTIASTLKAEINPAVELRIESPPTQNLEAYNLALESRQLSPVNIEENNKAIKLLERAIELDPEFSMAYFGIGFRLQVGATFQAADGGMDPQKAKLISRPYFEKAIALDPDNGIAHQFLAYSLLWFDWDFEGAKREYTEVKRIYPNSSWTDYLIATGEFDKALKEAKHSMDINPSDGLAWVNLINASFYAGKHAEALFHIQKALEDTTKGYYEESLVSISQVYMNLGRFQDALDIVELIKIKMPDLDAPRVSAVEAIANCKSGNTVEVNRILEKLKAHSMDNAGGSPAFYLAMIYTAMDQYDSAFQWLEKSYNDHEVELYWLKVDPAFRPITSDPRYQEMLEKVGIPG